MANKNSTKASGRGRPEVYTVETKVCVAAGKSKFQPESQRRAIFNAVVDNGGCMSIGDINSAFGYDTRATVAGLIRSEWFKVE